jgi:predicted regulator of Ras-like GTPase activity (Roadblock/LC7/MglB family)
MGGDDEVALKDTLGRFVAIDGVRALVVAGRDGLVIGQTDLPLPDAEALAAYGAQALSAAEGLGSETRRTALVGIVAEYGDALVSIDPLGELAVTVARLDTAAALVPLRQNLRQWRGDLLAALDAM